uniref:Ig-like domain-containing protein n=1 Tax=Anabas testudineus TaxID=64144 RepID=A0A7N6C444_ANATE
MSINFFVTTKYQLMLTLTVVSAVPSEIVEGSSVTLTCSSDANPAANYTWYKENEESPKASGQIFTITDIRAEHSGNYYCEVQNSLGRHTNTLHLTVLGGKLFTYSIYCSRNGRDASWSKTCCLMSESLVFVTGHGPPTGS